MTLRTAAPTDKTEFSSLARQTKALQTMKNVAIALSGSIWTFTHRLHLGTNTTKFNGLL